MTAPIPLTPGDTWMPTRPGSRAKARTVVAPAGYLRWRFLWVDGLGGAAFSTNRSLRSWIRRHAAVRTHAGEGA